MKQVLQLLLIATIIFSNEYHYRYTVHNDENTTIPTAIEEAINMYRGDIEPCNEYEGVPFDLNGDGVENTYIVRGFGECSGASADPVYLVQEQSNNTHKVILFEVTFSVDILTEKTNGYHNIKTSRGTASVYECEFWEFNGVEYDTTETYFITAYERDGCKSTLASVPGSVNSRLQSLKNVVNIGSIGKGQQSSYDIVHHSSFFH